MVTTWRAKYTAECYLELLGTLQVTASRSKCVALGYYFLGHIPYFYMAMGFRLWRRCAQRTQRFIDFVIHTIYEHNARLKRVVFLEWRDAACHGMVTEEGATIVVVAPRSPRHLTQGIRWKHLREVEKRMRKETTINRLATYSLSSKEEGIPCYRGKQHIRLYDDWVVEEGSCYSQVVVMQLCHGMVAYALSCVWSSHERDNLLANMAAEDPPDISEGINFDATATPREIAIRTMILHEAAVVEKAKAGERARRIGAAAGGIAKLSLACQATSAHALHCHINRVVAEVSGIWAAQRVRGRHVLARYGTRSATLRLHHAMGARHTFTGAPCLTRKDNTLLRCAIAFLRKWCKGKRDGGLPQHVMGCLVVEEWGKGEKREGKA